MAKTMNIRGLDDGVHQKLRVQAAKNNRSMEAEARAILTQALSVPTSNWLKEWLNLAVSIGPVDLPVPERNQPPRKVDLS